jgi:hypothetical protein
MKFLHRPDLFTWSSFDAARNIDFNAVLWVRKGGNVLIDPLPLSSHDRQHLETLGGASTIIVTNSDHTRGAEPLASELGAELIGPRGEEGGFPIACQRFASDGEAIVPGLLAIELHGSKTPGELALLIEQKTLVTGDLVRAQRAGRLNLLPTDKLTSRELAIESVRRLLTFPELEAVLVGDGWSIFRDGRARIEELLTFVSAKAGG